MVLSLSIGGGGGKGGGGGSADNNGNAMHRTTTSIPSPRKSPLQKKTSTTVASPLPSSPAKSPSSPSSVPVSKASFLCVKESLAEDLESRDEFELALQHAGRIGFFEELLKQFTNL